MFKKRIDELNVINGSAGTITGIKQESSGFKLSVNVQGKLVEFKTEDIADENGRIPLAHGYASTVYSAQGATVDNAFVIADHTMKRNEIYVAASRARDYSRIYVNRENIEKSVHSKVPLSDTSRARVPMKMLRDYLSTFWSQAQEKNSTRDYDLPRGGVHQLEKRNSSQNSANSTFQLPYINIEHG